MAQHRVYRSIVQAVNTEKLSEPFTVADFEKLALVLEREHT